MVKKRVNKKSKSNGFADFFKNKYFVSAVFVLIIVSGFFLMSTLSQSEEAIAGEAYRKSVSRGTTSPYFQLYKEYKTFHEMSAGKVTFRTFNDALMRSNVFYADSFSRVPESRIETRNSYRDLKKLVNEVYAGNIGFVLSSKLSKRDEYQNNLDRLLEEAKINPEFKRLVLNAVPKERRDNPNALIYPFAELATIQTMDTDIKVGPPYEVFYDGPAREFSPIVGFKKYVAIHLTRGFPFGNPDIPEGVSEEIEAFGILPYKITSKGLADYRIDPINDSLEKVASLIEETTDQRSLVDLLVILNQAKQRLGIKSENVYPTDLRELKDQATSSYTEYVHKPLRG